MANGVVEVLLIEDDPAHVRLFSEAASTIKTKFNLNVASTGAQALDFLFKRGKYAKCPRPDLIILDLNLPILSGDEVLAAIKANSDLAPIPVIIFSVTQNLAEVAKAYVLGASCYVVKPQSFEELEAVVTSVSDFWLSRVSYPPRAA